MPFDLQDIFTHLPPEIVQRILLYNRTLTATVVQNHFRNLCIQQRLEQAWQSLEFTDSESDDAID